ncbi:MAG TPA: hypothetical protein VE262_22030 [Blastocatellia bacterium]|nr:hypothetical protein [Blastocatellia bacterium]
MQIFRMLFPLRCEECGRVIKGEGFSGLGPGAICEACNKRLEEVRKLTYEASNRTTARQVIDRVNKDFPAEDADEVLAVLADYGKAEYEKSDQEFIRLAILRLANGDKQKLPSLVKMAKLDYRDILAPIHDEYGQNWLERFVNE